jgi:phosphoribosylglycinamide formyltransferase-1
VVPVEDGDDEDRLASRILAAEHRLYPLAVRLFAEGRLRVAGNRVAVRGGMPPGIAVLNPLDPLASAGS